MAINFTDFTDPRLRAQDNFEGVSNFLPNILKGYQAARAPEQMNTDLELKKAQTLKALREASGSSQYAPSDFAKLIQERNQMAQGNPKDPNLALYDQLIQRKAEGTPGMELSVGPNGEVTLSQGNRGTGSKGPQLITDENGNTRLVTPQTAEATNRLQQRQTAKAELENLEKIKQPYVGSGSIAELRNDKNTYNETKSPELFEKLVNAVLADLLVPERATLNLQSIGKVNVTDTDLRHQREVFKKGWPETHGFEFNNMPKEITEEAYKRYQQQTQQLGDIASQQYATGYPIDTSKFKNNISQSQQNMQQSADGGNNKLPPQMLNSILSRIKAAQGGQ